MQHLKTVLTLARSAIAHSDSPRFPVVRNDHAGVVRSVTKKANSPDINCSTYFFCHTRSSQIQG